MKKEETSMKQMLKEHIMRSKSFRLIFGILMVCIIALAGLVGLTVKENYSMSVRLQKQQNQYEQLKDEKETLSKNYESLQLDYANLECEITYYEDQQDTIKELESKIEKLEENNKKNNKTKTVETSEENQEDSIVTNSETSGTEDQDTSSTDVSYGTMVWLSETGTKYHSYSSCGNMNPAKARQVSESSAKAQGYQPCKNCW